MPLLRTLWLAAAAPLVILSASVSAAAAQTAQRCEYSAAAMMSLDVRTFDQSIGKGWRVLGPECEHEQAQLVKAYRSRHADLSPRDQRQLAFHEAQLRATTGENDEAIRLFESARQPVSEAVDENALYIDATLAFLRRDRVRLETAVQKYAALPKPEGFDAEMQIYQRQTGQTFQWPPNLPVLNALLECFGSTYRAAYVNRCRAGQ